MSLNGISTETVIVGGAIDPVATKIKRRTDKLDLAQTKRQTTGTYGYRVLNTITGTHVAYVSTSTATISGTTSPAIGHPWTLGV
jgi:hypothetical protein